MSIETNKRTFFNNDNLGAMLSSGDCSGKPGVASTDNNDISSFFFRMYKPTRKAG